MFHFVDNVQNTSGDALAGYYVKLTNTGTGAVIPLYADVSGTPIITTSGLPDAARTNSAGDFDFWVTEGTYNVDVYRGDGVTFFKRYANRVLGIAVSSNSISPESYGTVGNGTTDDAIALGNAIAAAASAHKQLELSAGRTYLVGGAGWAGLSNSGISQLRIVGNGATIKLGAVPSQITSNNETSPMLAISGASSSALCKLTLENIVFDLNGLAATPVAADYCDMNISGCSFLNGASASAVNGIFATRSTGTIRKNSFNGLNYGCTLGNPLAGRHCYGLTVTDNRFTSLRADGIAGYYKDSAITENLFDGVLVGVVLSAYATTSIFCDNVKIANNTIANFTGNGIQSDVVPGAIQNTNITVTGNNFRDGGASTAAIYALRTKGWTITGNQGINIPRGVYVDYADGITIVGNTFDAGNGTAGAFYGVYAIGTNGAVANVNISGNNFKGFTQNISVDSAANGAKLINIHGNSARGGGYGVYITNAPTGVLISGNIVTGQTTDYIAAYGVSGTNYTSVNNVTGAY